MTENNRRQKVKLVIRRKPGEDLLIRELRGIGEKSGRTLSSAGYPQVGHLLEEFRRKGKEGFIMWLTNVHGLKRIARACANDIQDRYISDDDDNDDSD